METTIFIRDGFDDSEKMSDKMSNKISDKMFDVMPDKVKVKIGQKNMYCRK